MVSLVLLVMDTLTESGISESLNAFGSTDNDTVLSAIAFTCTFSVDFSLLFFVGW